MRADSSIRAFRDDPRGFTGAEKALLICFALALIVLVGVLLQSGSRQAAGDARNALGTRAGGTQLGKVVAPLQSAGAIQEPVTIGKPASLARFSADFAGTSSPPPPPRRYVGPDPPASIGNAQQLAQFIHGRYGTDNPIGIIRVRNAGRPTYLLVLSGTELDNPRQATHVPEDVSSSFNMRDFYRLNILRALRDARVPRGADIIVAGHSLGGMEAQNLVREEVFRRTYNPIGVVTYGSPVTSFNLPGVRYQRFLAYNDPIGNLASLTSGNYAFWRTAAWGGHYLLRWGSFGYVDRRPVDIQTRVGLRTPSLNPLAPHSSYPHLDELSGHPITLPDGRPLELDPDSFRTFDNRRVLNRR